MALDYYNKAHKTLRQHRNGRFFVPRDEVLSITFGVLHDVAGSVNSLGYKITSDNLTELIGSVEDELIGSVEDEEIVVELKTLSLEMSELRISEIFIS